MQRVSLAAYVPFWSPAPEGDAISKAFAARRLAFWRRRGVGKAAASGRANADLATPLARRALHVALSAVGALVLVAIAAALLAGLYWVKSAVGIDLLAGHSVLHDALYAQP
ncbi:MAG: hypothetical protein AAFQ45_15640 [Pseudomonadota bacterium]